MVVVLRKVKIMQFSKEEIQQWVDRFLQIGKDKGYRDMFTMLSRIGSLLPYTTEIEHIERMLDFSPFSPILLYKFDGMTLKNLFLAHLKKLDFVSAQAFMLSVCTHTQNTLISRHLV